ARGGHKAGGADAVSTAAGRQDAAPPPRRAAACADQQPVVTHQPAGFQRERLAGLFILARCSELMSRVVYRPDTVGAGRDGRSLQMVQPLFATSFPPLPPVPTPPFYQPVHP